MMMPCQSKVHASWLSVSVMVSERALLSAALHLAFGGFKGSFLCELVSVKHLQCWRCSRISIIPGILHRQRIPCHSLVALMLHKLTAAA